MSGHPAAQRHDPDRGHPLGDRRGHRDVQPSFPSEAGKTSYASNLGYYRGEVGFSAGVMHRFDGDFAITAGISYAGGENTAVRAGIAGEF